MPLTFFYVGPMVLEIGTDEKSYFFKKNNFEFIKSTKIA